MWRRSIIVFAILCGAVAGTVVALKSRRVADNLKAYAARIAHEKYGVTLHIDELELDLLPPGVAVSGVEVYRPDRDDAWIELHRGRIVIRPWPSAAGALVIHHLELDGLRADFDLRGTGDLLGGSDTGDGSRIAIDVRELLLWNIDVSVETDDGRVAVRRTDVRLAPAPTGGREFELSLGEAELSRGDRRVSLEAKARGLFRGSIDRPESIRLDHATINLTEIAVSAKGSLNLVGAPTVDVVLEGKAPLSRLRQIIGDLPDIDGDFHALVHVQGPILSPRTRVRAELNGIRYAGLQLGDLDVDVVHSGTHINIESFRFANRSAGVVTGSGNIEIAADIPLTITARLHRASLPHILA
ncbi:MAG: hypothetical protein V3T05_02335, partial [Myxococcota bacterium]